ncbi:MAG: hypothetical protein ABIO76_07970, partial [Ginsengibacter sp.]
PRSLTAAQYHNPYKAIAKFCNYMPHRQWKMLIKEMLAYALNNETIYEGNPGYDILKVRKRMLQMVEAARLIDVRMCKEKNFVQAAKNQTEST